MNNLKKGNIYRWQSNKPDTREAVQELYEGISQPDTSLVLFFCSSNYDSEEIAVELGRLFSGVQIVGCTSAGEIGPTGYLDHSICGVSFPRDSFTAVNCLLEDLDKFEFQDGEKCIQSMLRKLESQNLQVSSENTFAVLLIDGLSIREELVTRSLQNALGSIPLVGGSAGDDMKFLNTGIYADGQFHSNAAAVVLFSTPRPFRVFRSQHFIPMEERLVVTEADAAKRIVFEINGRPASEEYARVIGTDPKNLQPLSFAGSPIVVLIDGGNYVRSIQRSNSDGSLTFFCAIEEGVVLRVAQGIDLVANMAECFETIREEIGTPDLVLGCDCVLRKVEIVQDGLTNKVTNIFQSNHTVGFNTYGEQYRGVHVNQTLTGVAIGSFGSDNDDE